MIDIPILQVEFFERSKTNRGLPGIAWETLSKSQLTKVAPDGVWTASRMG